MASKKAKGECCGNVIRDTILAQSLLWDNFSQSGAHYDCDPLGAYKTRYDGSVIFQQIRIVSLNYVPCSTAVEIDKLVARVLIAVAKHANRYAVIEKRMVRDTLGRLPSGRTWQGGNLHFEDAVRSSALPRNAIVRVACHPEVFGRIGHDCDGYGVAVMAPHALSVIEVVSDLTGSRETVVG